MPSLFLHLRQHKITPTVKRPKLGKTVARIIVMEFCSTVERIVAESGVEEVGEVMVSTTPGVEGGGEVLGSTAPGVEGGGEVLGLTAPGIEGGGEVLGSTALEVGFVVSGTAFFGSESR